MKNGVVLNMNDMSALLTVAMLSAIYDSKKKDYLELIIPFVINVLPKKVNEKVNIDELVNKLKIEYGFEDIPINVINKILARLAKKEKDKIVKEDKEYVVKAIFDTSKFEEKRNKMKVYNEEIFRTLNTYLQKTSLFKEVTIEETRKRFLLFLETYGYITLKDTDYLRTVTLKKDQNNYYIAKFIINEYEKDSSIFDKILEIIKGFLIYKAIYFLSSEQKKEIQSKLNGTEFYFDTRLLIYALGYNNKEESDAINELIELIYSNGGKVKTFEHIKNEVAGILTKYAKDEKVRNSLSLEYLNANNYTENDVMRLRDRLNENLKEKRIEVVDTPEYGMVTSIEDLSNKGYLDLEELKKILENNVKYNKLNKEKSLNNDIETISAISRLRGKPKQCTIENCKAILVTTNFALVLALRDAYKERFLKGEINFVITDIDLTSILWVSSFNKSSKIPKLKLMESAYAACYPAEDVIEVFYDKVQKLENEGKIDSNVIKLMRTYKLTKDIIVEETGNDSNNISDETVGNVVQKLIENIKKEESEKSKMLERKNEEIKLNFFKLLKETKNEYYEKAKKTKRLIKIILTIIFSLVVFYGVYLFFKENNNSKYFVLFIGGLGIFDSLNSRYVFIKKLAYYFVEKYYDKKYSEQYEKIKKYFSDEIEYFESVAADKF